MEEELEETQCSLGGKAGLFTGVWQVQSVKEAACKAV